jgi:hypothetical protein
MLGWYAQLPVLLQELVFHDDLIQRNQDGEAPPESGEHRLQVHVGWVNTLRCWPRRVQRSELVHHCLDHQVDSADEPRQPLEKWKHPGDSELGIPPLRVFRGVSFAVQHERRVKIGLGLEQPYS